MLCPGPPSGSADGRNGRKAGRKRFSDRNDAGPPKGFRRPKKARISFNERQFVDAPAWAVCDGELQSDAVQVTASPVRRDTSEDSQDDVGSSEDDGLGDGTGVLLAFEFPPCDSYLAYDPTVANERAQGPPGVIIRPPPADDDNGTDRAPGSPFMRRRRAGMEAYSHSGEMRLCGSGNCEEQYVRCQLKELAEVDSGGTVVTEALALSSTDFAWELEDPVTDLVDYFDRPVAGHPRMTVDTQLRLSKRAGIVRFKIEAMLPEEDAILNPYSDFIPNEELASGDAAGVQANSLKFSVQVQDWPYQDMSNKLRLGMRCAALGPEDEDERAPDEAVGSGNAVHKRVTFGTGQMLSMPLKAMVR
ncbi:unnamed protein product, partial [Chrysoparadoxa australica]